jgi:hypothetical protein
MKDYSRKHYTDFQFKDWMKSTPSKAVWNSILSQSVGLGEFSANKNIKSSLDSSIAQYLRQSELKKPNLDNDFVGMENTWEGPPGFTRRPDGPQFDQPWNTSLGASTFIVIFDLRSDSKYCPGETKDFEIRGSHPIYLLELFGEIEGTSITIYGGYGTNSVTGSVTASENQKGSIIFNGSMQTSEGKVGASNYLMPEGREDCCDFDNLLLPDPVNTPETVAVFATATIYVLGGQGPFTWSFAEDTVCGELPRSDFREYFELSANVTEVRNVDLLTNGFSRGVAVVRCVDACGTVVDQSVRCTTGMWVAQFPFECKISGPHTEAGGGVLTLIDGCIKQISRIADSPHFDTNATGCNDDPEEDNCQAAGWVPNAPECVSWDCTAMDWGETCEYPKCFIFINEFTQTCYNHKMRNEWFLWGFS